MKKITPIELYQARARRRLAEVKKLDFEAGVVRDPRYYKLPKRGFTKPLNGRTMNKMIVAARKINCNGRMV